jgi:hypothetical protein
MDLEATIILKQFHRPILDMDRRSVEHNTFQLTSLIFIYFFSSLRQDILCNNPRYFRDTNLTLHLILASRRSKPIRP